MNINININIIIIASICVIIIVVSIFIFIIIVTAVVAIRRCSGPLISVSLASAALVVSCTRNVLVLLVVGYFRRRFRRRLHQHFIAVGIIAISNFGSID